MRIAEIEKRCAGQEWRPCPKVLTSSRAAWDLVDEATALVTGSKLSRARARRRVRRENRRDRRPVRSCAQSVVDLDGVGTSGG
jgi:hypothetical protein